METKEKEIVPFNEAQIKERDAVKFTMAKIDLPRNRSVSVGVAEDGDRFIEIDRPTDDGKVSRLKFGLTEDAAFALFIILGSTFEIQPYQRDLTAKED